MKLWKKILISILSIVVILFIVSFIYLNVGQYEATSQAEELFEQEALINDDYAVFDNDSTTGIIFYQGAKVDYESYSYLSEIENANIYIPDFFYNIAMFDTNAANDIINGNPEIKEWYIMGHSLGGFVAINYALDNEDKISGVITLGGYPSSEIEDTSLEFYAFFATNDGLIPDYQEKAALFPQETTIDLIEGGNHSQYGDYGFQSGDNEATISSDQQHEYIIEHTSEFIE